MAGNVAEWTCGLYGRWDFDLRTTKCEHRYPLSVTSRSIDAPPDYTRVVRGGAFLNYASDARCAQRVRDLPDNRNFFIGFRVCASPLRPL
jgi:formylglycine-generating enzyme required for sulfatase activity